MGKKQICFECHQALGDILCMTAGVRDFCKQYHDKYEVSVKTTYGHIWDNTPYLKNNDNDSEVVYRIGTKIGAQSSNRSGRHICESHRRCIEDRMNLQIEQGPIGPSVFLSDEEKATREIQQRYWLITTGGRAQMSTKLWPYERWQEVVDAFPELMFVQVGAASDYHPRLTGNVIDMIGQTDDDDYGIRRLFSLAYHAEGAITVVTGLMHLMAAFEKPCVVVAGAREPTSFERYNGHMYLTNHGAMRCPNMKPDGKKIPYDNYNQIQDHACWRSSLDSCPRTVEHDYGVQVDNARLFGVHKFAACMDMITTTEAINALRTYYTGGRLSRIGKTIWDRKLPPKIPDAFDKLPKNLAAMPELIPIIQKPDSTVSSKPVVKFVCNTVAWGGGEMSSVTLMNMLAEAGCEVHFCPMNVKRINKNMGEALSPDVQITTGFTDQCDIMIMYANDWPFKFDDRAFCGFHNIQAKKRIMILNCCVGKAAELPPFCNWDLYGFLSTDLRDGFLKKKPDANTFVLPPPVDLTKFLDAPLPDYSLPLRIVRLTSQAGQKIPKCTAKMINEITLYSSNVKFYFMESSENVPGYGSVVAYSRDRMPVIDFLQQGNLFWYPLPEGYTDQGPRVIMEAMAAGLPIIADNYSGAKDRVTEETGWLCDSHDQYTGIIASLKYDNLETKGKAARERARTEFNPQRWVDQILGVLK